MVEKGGILLYINDMLNTGWRDSMGNILIRDIDEQLDKALRVRAIKHGLSREAEIKSILEAVVAKRPKKRTLAEALMDIPKMDSDIDIDDLFERSSSPVRELD